MYGDVNFQPYTNRYDMTRDEKVKDFDNISLVK